MLMKNVPRASFARRLPCPSNGIKSQVGYFEPLLDEWGTGDHRDT